MFLQLFLHKGKGDKAQIHQQLSRGPKSNTW